MLSGRAGSSAPAAAQVAATSTAAMTAGKSGCTAWNGRRLIGGAGLAFLPAARGGGRAPCRTRGACGRRLRRIEACRAAGSAARSSRRVDEHLIGLVSTADHVVVQPFDDVREPLAEIDVDVHRVHEPGARIGRRHRLRRKRQLHVAFGKRACASSCRDAPACPPGSAAPDDRGAPAKSPDRFEAILEAGVDEQKQAIDGGVTDRPDEGQERASRRRTSRAAWLRCSAAPSGWRRRAPETPRRRARRRARQPATPCCLQPLEALRQIAQCPAGSARASAAGSHRRPRCRRAAG